MVRPCLFAGKAERLAPQAPHRLEAGVGIPNPSLFLFTAPASCLILLQLRQGIILSGVQLQGAGGPELSL